MGSHNDWVLDTAFSADGSHLISVGRDMTAKLTEVATQRFVDNITSITPGALKGGHRPPSPGIPKRDEIVVGGSDGIPRLYRIFRQTVRVIGDDSNLIREFDPMQGRINAVAVSADGKRFAAGSSLDGAGEVDVYGYEFDTNLPDNIKAIMSKVATTRSGPEVEALQKYLQDGVKLISKVDLPHAAVYALAFAPTARRSPRPAPTGSVRVCQHRDRHADQGVRPGPGEPAGVDRRAGGHGRRRRSRRSRSRPRRCPKGAKLVALKVEPTSVELTNRFAYAQLARDGPARLGRPDRRDPDGRGQGRRRAASRSRGRAWSGPWPTARSTLALIARRPEGRGPRGRRRACNDRPGSTSSTTSTRSCPGSAATRGPATARPRARTASSSRSAATTRSSTSGP